TSKPASPSYGGEVATRLDASSDPNVVARLQSGTVDQRVLAVLAVLTASQPVALEDISSTDGEDAAGSPKREFTLKGPAPTLQSMAAFFQQQDGPFAAESIKTTPKGLTVRFPVAAKDFGLGGTPVAPADPPAAVRVVDMRRARPADHLEFVRIDGTPAGSRD